MTEQDPDILSEEEAARLWERAAQLQAESTGETETPDVQDARIHTPGYALTHVRSAALEAGIDSEYVETALAELRADRFRADAARDASKAALIAPFAADCQRLRESIDGISAARRQRTDELRWMVEEYRVSVFAQELGTAQRVSAKRLERQLEVVQKAE